MTRGAILSTREKAKSFAFSACFTFGGRIWRYLSFCPRKGKAGDRFSNYYDSSVVFLTLFYEKDKIDLLGSQNISSLRPLYPSLQPALHESCQSFFPSFNKLPPEIAAPPSVIRDVVGSTETTLNTNVVSLK